MSCPGDIQAQSHYILEFLKGIVGKRHLYDSPEFRQFILDPATLHIAKENWYEQAEKYKCAFPQWDNFVITDEEIGQVIDNSKSLRHFISKIADVNKACKEAGIGFQQVKRHSDAVVESLITYMVEFSAFASNEVPLRARAEDYSTQSFPSLCIRLNTLEAQVNSMIETVERVKALEAKSAKLRGKLRDSNVQLINLQAGKLTFRNLFKRRNEEGILAQETLVKQTESNLNGLTTVKRIGITRLLREELPAFISHLKTDFNQTLDDFARRKNQELNGLTCCWRPFNLLGNTHK